MLVAFPVLHRKALARKWLHSLSCSRILKGEADLQKTTVFIFVGLKMFSVINHLLGQGLFWAQRLRQQSSCPWSDDLP